MPPTAWQAAQAFRYGRAGMQIHLALDELPAVGLARGRTARAHGPAARHARASTASRARSTRPSAACCRPRRRSSSASPRPSIPAARRRASRSSGSSCRSCRGGRPATRSARSTSATAPGRETLREAYADRIVERLGGADREPRARDAQARRALAGRPRGAQLQPRRRRHLRRLLRARPEPAVAAERAAPGPRHGRSTGSGRSAPPRTPGRASARAPATSWPSSCCARRCAGACSSAAPRPPASCASACRCEDRAERDLDAGGLLRRGRRGLRRGGLRRHRHLGVQAARRRCARARG